MPAEGEDQALILPGQMVLQDAPVASLRGLIGVKTRTLCSARGRIERRDQVVHVEHEPPGQGHAPQGEFLGPLLPGALPVFDRRGGLPDGRAHHAVPAHFEHPSGRHEQAPVDGEPEVHQVVDAVVFAKSQELVSVFRHALVAQRSRLGREVESGKAALYVGGVVRADEDPLAAEFLQFPQTRIGWNRLGRRGGGPARATARW